MAELVDAPVTRIPCTNCGLSVIDTTAAGLCIQCDKEIRMLTLMDQAEELGLYPDDVFRVANWMSQPSMQQTLQTQQTPQTTVTKPVEPAEDIQEVNA